MRFFGLSWSLGRLRGVDIRFHFSMVLSIPIAYYLFDPIDVRGIIEALLWVIGFTLFILLHEMGHAFAAQMVGVEVKSIVVWLLGGLTNLAYKPEKPAHNFFIYAAGPLMNMVLAFFCVLAYILMAIFFLPVSQDPQAYVWVQTFQNLFFSLAIVNLILIVFNLIPVYPLDGGNIFHAAMEWMFGKTYADRITLAVGIPFLFLLIALAVFSRDYLLLAFCVLIALSISTLNHSLLKNINLGLAYLFKRPGYYYLKGDYERAAQIYTAEIEKQPEDINNYLARAGCYLAIGQRERALADVDRVLRISPRHLLALELRGEIFMLNKDLETAAEHFLKVQQINPNWAISYFDIASLHMERGELQLAIENFNKSIMLQPRMPLFYIIRSLAHFKAGDLSSAHRDQDIAVGISPEEALVMVDVNLMVYEQNLDWARDYYDRVLDKNPRNAPALQGFAEACLVNQEFDEAVTFFSRALEINPQEGRVYLGRGKAYVELGKIEEARSDFEKAATLSVKLHLRRQAENLLRSLSTN
ncbi:MAG: M50 family metallopeptidase [Anaerolineales bacterium]